MKQIKRILSRVLAVVLFFAVSPLSAQEITQIIKGNVYDNESQGPLPGANIIIPGTTPPLGTISDPDGNYKINNVPIGRYNIQISYIGYDAVIIPEVLVTSGKEVVVNAGLKQSVTELDEATVKAYTRKDKPLNTMASISARSFSVEETRRYAGGVDDPARMVSAFAGITVGNLQDNAIIIRGNAPKGVSWRLEGVEIPNPNHFAGGNIAGGGALTIFSSQLLSNSDFFTGAFPAEYGNALAGVFDMKLRTGNSGKREHAVQAGMLGVDFSSEGPIKKGRNATYLFNYRYSTFGILTGLGIIPSDQIPMYQDLSFKLNFPTQNAGTFSLWGIGAIDVNKEPDEKDSTKWESDWDRIKYDWNLNMGSIGLSHKLILGNQTFINTTLAGTGINNKLNQTRLDDNLVSRKDAYLVDNSSKIILSSFVNHKFNAKSTLKTGVNYYSMFYYLDLNSTVDGAPETFQNFVKEDGQSTFLELYAQTRYDFTENISVNGGINVSWFALNDNFSIDPRLGLKWEFHPGHSLSFGYGKHSQLEELKIYRVKREMNGMATYPNKDLKVSKAHHFIVGYDWLINKDLRLKVEPYYQYLYDIPGIPDSSYSFINFEQDWAFMDSLANNSTGRNIGIDVTLERFLANNYYYLVTASVFDSKYKADDGVWRDTRFNKGYVFNLLVGKEFFLNRNRILGVNGRLNYMGGIRYSPVLLEESLNEKSVIYDETKAFEAQASPMYYLDMTITYRTNKRRYSGVWALQVKNVLGSPAFGGKFYNYKTHKIESDNYVVILPVLSYKIEF